MNWKFRVQFSKPDEDQVARLMRVLNQKVPVTLECVDEEEKGDNFDQVEQLPLTGTEPSAARLEAESLFSAPPTDMELDNTAATEKAVASVVASIDNVTAIKGKRGSKKKAVAEIE